MGKACLIKTQYSWEMTTKCPRCKKKIEDYWDTDKPMGCDKKEIRCPECGLIFTESMEYGGYS